MDRPGVGVGVIIIKDNKVLLGKRKGSHGEGSWSFPGGHLEMNESVEDCARREVAEETGLIIGEMTKQTYTNDIFSKEGKHYVTIYVKTKHIRGEPAIMEPDKCAGWDWFSWDNLPSPLFIPLQNLLKDGYNPFI